MDTDVGVILVGIFYDLIKNILPISGWLLAWVSITGFTTSTPYVQAWKSKDHDHFLCSTLFLVVTKPLHSKVRVRSPFGKHGEHIKSH